jgi:hypothetical protein
MNDLKQTAHDDSKVISGIIYVAITLVALAIVSSVILLTYETGFFQNSVTYNLTKIGAWCDVPLAL